MASEFFWHPLTTSKLADLADVQATTVVNWQTRGIFGPFFGTHVRGKHREYTPIDVLRLAMIAKLVAWGMPHDKAAQCVDSTIGPRIQMLDSYRNTPRAAIAAGLRSMRIRVYRPTWGWHVYHANGPTPDEDYIEDFSELRIGPLFDRLMMKIEVELGWRDPATGALIEQSGSGNSAAEAVQ